MNWLWRFLTWGVVFLVVAASAQEKPKKVENDLMYPLTDAVKPYIDFDGAGFSMNGQRTFFSSGSIHYSRVPHELWADRLLRLKQASFAGVETYAFWNFHEVQENQFDFSGDKDFEKFLETAQQMGLYAMVRVGPYVCAEWDSGGYPVWLKFKPPFKVRGDNPAWLSWNDHWYEKILPMVAKHEIDHGGNVVLVQLENEHPLGWGVVTNDPYFVHLNDEAMKFGIDVPHFMSGQHHGAAPTPGNLDPEKRTNPWITTEFWSGWFDTYGSLAEKRNHEIENAIWTILAHGGGGYNFYMLHGGTDFETWNNDEMAASYDDGAAIGQGGDLRPTYYIMKRANQLAQSFPEILANGGDARGDYADFATGTGVKVIGARKSRSGAGTLVFVQNSSSNEITATFKSGEEMKLAQSSVYALPQNVRVTDSVKVVEATLPVLAIARNGETVTLVVYGQPEKTGRVSLSVEGGVKAGMWKGASKNFQTELIDGNRLNLKITIPKNGVEEFKLEQGKQCVRVLALNRDLTAYTWIVGATNRQFVVCGPEFVQGIEENGKKISVTIERPYGQASCGQVAVFGGREQSFHLGVKADLKLDGKAAPELTNWKMSAMREISPAFDDSKWRRSPGPAQMGADGDTSAFAWYRASVNVPSPASGALRLHGADNMEVFVNGRHVTIEKNVARTDFAAGTNSIAVFASHHGRSKAFGYLGTLDNFNNKGLWGSQKLEMDGLRNDIPGWAMRGGVETDLAAIKSWSEIADAKGAPTFYHANFNYMPPGELGAHPILRVNFHGLSRGTMWVNGRDLGRYPEKIKIDSLYIPECWLKAGKNDLTVFDETGQKPSQVELVIEKAASREVIRVSKTVDAKTPMIVPQKSP
ncbi:MAG TPA: beta-galactosidase [Verrucomicrobiae bacterium]|nr:beta-galactosidase [Verrucomicrobiae bacterium]